MKEIKTIAPALLGEKIVIALLESGYTSDIVSPRELLQESDNWIIYVDDVTFDVLVDNYSENAEYIEDINTEVKAEEVLEYFSNKLKEKIMKENANYIVGCDKVRQEDVEVGFNPQPHYDNSNGSLYKIAQDLGLNHWEFDIFKRLTRCRKKNQFREDLQKIKDTIDIYVSEYNG